MQSFLSLRIYLIRSIAFLVLSAKSILGFEAGQLSFSPSFNLVANITRSAYPQVIGHAGASGYLPESSLEGYDFAANLLADYSEPDLVLTKDGYFVAMHDLTLEGTTNVESFPEFEDRKDTFVIEGQAITGYYAVNFTLSEIKTLRLRQRFSQETGQGTRNTLFDWMFSVPTLQEIISWQISHYNSTGRLVGIYPELKHPDWYNSIGYPMEDMLLEVLSSSGYHVNDPDTPRDLSKVIPVAIQCFKSSSLKYLAGKTNIPLVQLMGVSSTYPTPELVYNEATLDEIMTYAQAVGPDKMMFTTDWGVSVRKAVQMRSWARERNLFFVPWSFQQEAKYVPLQFDGDALMELQYFYGCLESTALFHEFPDRAREVVDSCDNSYEGSLSSRLIPNQVKSAASGAYHEGTSASATLLKRSTGTRGCMAICPLQLMNK